MLAALQEFALPSVVGSSQPGAIATGSDGNLWFTNAATNAIGRVTPGGQVTSFPIPRADARAGAITAAPDGALYFAEFSASGGARVGRITTSGQVSEFPIPSGRQINTFPGGGIAAGPDGNVWFVEAPDFSSFGFGSPAVGRITPDGQISEFPVPAGLRFLSDIVAGSDGNLWFTGSEEIGRITPSGQVTEYPIPPDPGVTSHYPFSIAAGPDGALWFTERDSDQIGRITTGGQIQQFAVPSMPNDLSRITSGPDGALWFIESFGSTVGRIATDGSVAEFDIFPTPRVLNGITTGPDGNLWITDATGNVGRLSTTGVLTEFAVPGVGLPPSPTAITPGPDGDLWFSEATPDGDDRVGRITTGGVATLFPLPGGTVGVTSIVNGPDGRIWFTTANSIGRITQSGVVKLFPLPTAGFRAQEITAGPDGNLWFTENFYDIFSPFNSAAKVGRITTDGKITEFPVSIKDSIGATATLGGIATGSDGNLWFRAGGTVGRITPAGKIRSFSIPVDRFVDANSGGSITAGPDGALWFPYNKAIGRIGTDGAIRLFPIFDKGPFGGGFQGGITVGRDRNLWFTDDNRIGRVTTSGVVTYFATPTAASNTRDIAAGPDGNLYFTEQQSGKVGRVNLRQVDKAPAIQRLPFATDERDAFSGAVFRISGLDRDAARGAVATINWGDFTPTTTVKLKPGDRADVKATHTYRYAGTYPVTLVILGRDGGSTTVATQATVRDVPPTFTGSRIQAVAGQAFSGEVGSIVDIDPGFFVGTLITSIDWGDGTFTEGSLAAQGARYVVSGSHAYAGPGIYTLSISVGQFDFIGINTTGVAVVAG